MQCLVLHLDIALLVELQFAQEIVDDALLIVGWFPVPFLACLAVIQRPKRDGGLQVRIASAGCTRAQAASLKYITGHQFPAPSRS